MLEMVLAGEGWCRLLLVYNSALLRGTCSAGTSTAAYRGSVFSVAARPVSGSAAVAHLEVLGAQPLLQVVELVELLQVNTAANHLQWQ